MTRYSHPFVCGGKINNDKGKLSQKTLFFSDTLRIPCNLTFLCTFKTLIRTLIVNYLYDITRCCICVRNSTQIHRPTYKDFFTNALSVNAKMLPLSSLKHNMLVTCRWYGSYLAATISRFHVEVQCRYEGMFLFHIIIISIILFVWG